MNKYSLLTAFILFCSICFGQGTKEIEFINKDCPSLTNCPFLVDELALNEKEITAYLETKFPKYHLKNTAVEFNLVFLPNTQPCCRRTVIVDPTLITKAQKDTLLKYILQFPNFNNIKTDKPKQLKIFVAFDNKSQPNCTFIPAYRSNKPGKQ